MLHVTSQSLFVMVALMGALEDNAMSACRPDWGGTLHMLMSTHRGKLQALVGADVGFEHFAKVSGVQAVAEVRQQLDARLAARGAAPLRRNGLLIAIVACILICKCTIRQARHRTREMVPHRGRAAGGS